MKIAILTLGCRTNQAESAGMAELLRSRGHETVDSGQLAVDSLAVDAVIINTCTVTATADKKSRNAIRRLRKLYPNALLAVCGCLTQTEAVGIEGIDLIGGTSGRAAFVAELEKALTSPGPSVPPAGGGEFSDAYEDTLPDARPIGRSRAYIKIQDGCDNLCAYCKVPLARGRARSRPAGSVIKAAKQAADGGAVEIVLTGIEISSYRPSLAELTADVCRAAAPVPARLSSLAPSCVDDLFVNALKEVDNFRPAFHLSLQSCCDKTLAAMGRRYAVSDIFAFFERVRGAWENAVITADVIVGFPGETGADFEKTLQNLRKLKPDGLHIFPYSRREGTAAAAMPGQLTRAIKTERARRLAAEFPKGT